MPKHVKGGPFGFINRHCVAKYQKTLGTLKIYQKRSHSAEKNPKGDPLGTSGYVSFLEKVKKGRGPFGLSLSRPDLALGGFRNVSQKWTDQCQDCSL